MIQLIVSDLDGTLLNEKKQMTPRTADAIRQIQQRGIRFLLNTEREYFDAKTILDPMGIQCDMICSGGAYIVDQEGQTCPASYISRDKIEPMLRLFGKYCAFYEIYSAKGRCILGVQEAYEAYLTGEVFPSMLEEDKNFSMTEEVFDQILAGTKFYDNIHLLLDENPEIVKITSRSNDTWKLEQLRNEIQQMIPELAVSEDTPYGIEVTAIEAQKGVALTEYVKREKLSLRDTLVIGDGLNDYSMLALPYVRSIAMGNSSWKIKEICEFQTKTNEEDGAAFVFEKLI